MENSAQKGYEYEKKASEFLKQFGITDGSYDGSKNQGPDIVLHTKTKSTGCELKILPTAAGSLVLKYYDDEWHYGDVGDDEEKQFMRDLGEQKGALKEIKKKWKSPPLLQYKNDKKTYPKLLNERTAYQQDIKTFGSEGYGDIYIPVDGSDISNYYIKKNCSYLNVGTHGFYLLEDEFNLNSIIKGAKIPNFASSITARIRIRIQYKSPGYQFALTTLFSGVRKSPYNLAPIAGSTSVNIIKNQVSEELIEAFKKAK
jgi:hypothetical protein